MNGLIAILSRHGTLPWALETWLAGTRQEAPDVRVRVYTGNQIAAQRNGAVRELADRPWVLYVDDDTVPPPGALPALCEADRDVIGGVVLLRHPDARGVDEWPVAAWRTPTERYTVRSAPRRGVHPVSALGAACLLVRREVFDAVGPPWFRCGQLDPEFLDEDLDFCLRAAGRGFPPYLHAGVRCGHQTTGTLWPGRDGRPWVEWPGPVECRVPLTIEVPSDTPTLVPEA